MKKDVTKKRLTDKVAELKEHVIALRRLEAKHRSAEKALKESEEKYRTLTENLLEGILIIDFKGKILYGNEAMAKMVGYKKTEEGIGKNVFSFIAPKYRKVAVKDLLKVYRDKWGFLTTYKGRDIYGREFWVETLGRKITYQGKTAELVVVRDITARKEMEEALERAKSELEMKVGERTRELKITNEQLRREIAERKKAEDRLQQSFEKLQRLLKETVGALASAVEAKDPYTAGHQERVAQLACSIARELGLEEERIRGINMAAILHDIGKIYVPAEILNKPGPLTEAEVNVIRAHTQLGYDLLKSIEFPWPVAKIVLQHHERVDGSGYPFGISGKHILLEAKILAVSDVVEAISSHRPYRSALGVDKALDEISHRKGAFYDPDVAYACIKLFAEKKFKFKPVPGPVKSKVRRKK